MTSQRPGRVLITGAAGRIGSHLSEFLTGRFPLRLADLDVSGLDPGPEVEVEQLDITDLDACRRACAGISTVVHLAADPSQHADFIDSLLHTNVLGTYHVFRAAADQGCQRVVFASSVNVMTGYPTDFQTHVDTPVRPGNMYGVSKCFGEATASYFAHVEGLPAIAVRIGHFRGEKPAEPLSTRDQSAYLSSEDMCQLFLRCIEQPDIGFAIVHGVSDNRFKLLDLSTTSEMLGYHPHDDGFEFG